VSETTGAAALAPRSTAKLSVTALTYAVAAAVIVTAAAMTVWMCASMSGGMPMAGGWELSMAWMPMGGQGWGAATAMFLAMWLAMMVAMMLPSSLPVLLLYQRTLHFRGDPASARKTLFVGLGYFAVWFAFGAVAFACGVGITQAALGSDAMSRAVPIAAALTLIAAGVYQLTPAKAACLRHCRGPFEAVAGHIDHGPWRLGLHHGLWCAGCCVGIMLVQLVVGVMNLSAMAALAAWIALEKLTPFGARLARVGGVVAILAGIVIAMRPQGGP
jgi:predicted metal-binding membrane protein